MSTLNFLTVAFLVGAGSCVQGQTKHIVDFTPAQKSVMDSAGRECVRARTLLHEGKASEALALARQSVLDLESVKEIDLPADHYLVAQCYLALGQRSMALDEFKKCFAWGVQKGDLVPRVSDWAGCAADYAVTLSQAGRTDDAKRMYYYALRNINWDGSTRAEPYPFLVVFDPSPTGDVWSYSESRLEAACLMVKAIAAGGGDDFLGWIDRAGHLAPNWLYPPLYHAFERPGSHPETFFARARAIADTQEKKDLVNLVESYNIDHMPASAPNPAKSRAALQILQTSKADLAKHHSNVVELAR